MSVLLSLCEAMRKPAYVKWMLKFLCVCIFYIPHNYLYPVTKSISVMHQSSYSAVSIFKCLQSSREHSGLMEAAAAIATTITTT